MQRQPLIKEVIIPFPPPRAFELFKDQPYPFFLDGGMDAGRLGRYSLMGSEPFLVFRSQGSEVTLTKEGSQVTRTASPFDILDELLKIYSLAPSPLPLAGGVVGYFAYDLGRLLERLPSIARDDLGLPECYLGFYDRVLVCDNLTGRAYITSSGFPEIEESRRVKRAQERLGELAARLAGPLQIGQELFPPVVSDVMLRSNFSQEGYLQAVERVREYIKAGDTFQVNLSQRFEAHLAISPYELYRRLRQVNPAPFAAYLESPEVAVVSASPERFLRVEGERVETRPIKGTRPRGDTPTRDGALARELLSSPKDRAENVMIVDLERNDLGRVCRYGSVQVTELAILEKFPTVFHLTSTVVGRLRPDKSRLDLLRAAFPGGSITGAPKVRAMEIIEEMEPTRRSIYTGALGYLSFDGKMDLNIVIRTFIIKNGRAYFQVGGGIVYDSRPEAEYQETLDKARGLVLALKLAPEVTLAR